MCVGLDPEEMARLNCHGPNSEKSSSQECFPNISWCSRIFFVKTNALLFTNSR